jgi:glucose/mannose transport system permease protein
MTKMAFGRSEIGLASASAIMMFATVSAIIVPYLYSELRREQDAK